MDYKCYCGATLKYSRDGKWFCPNGHTIYTCKKCEALGRNTPLQWIPSYQQWYCYECKQYAPSTPSTKKNVEEASEEEYDELLEGEDEEDEVKVSGYKLGIPRGSRVDEFCFMCKNLEFTQNNTHIRCRMKIPRFLEPATSEVTIRPTGAGKGVSGICGQASFISGDALLNLQSWREYIEKIVEKQIENHEKEAAPVEMYRIEFVGASTADAGVNATRIPISRDSIIGGRITVTIDDANQKVWVHAATKKSGFLTGLAKVVGGIAGSMEDIFSPRYLRDLLKRDIESFSVEKIWAGEEPSEFLQVLDDGARQSSVKLEKQTEELPAFEGPRIEMYQLNYHMGRAYGEYYTGGRSDSETKSITLEPLKASIEELQSKRMVVVVDHQAKIVWHWMGDKSARLMKFFVRRIPSNSQSRRQHIGIIGSRIGRNIDDYDYVVVEEKKEPDQFKRLFQT
jgi:hypothetical protein